MHVVSTSVRVNFKHVRVDRAGVLSLYLKLNRGGTDHTEEEIARVRTLLIDELGLMPPDFGDDDVDAPLL